MFDVSKRRSSTNQQDCIYSSRTLLHHAVQLLLEHLEEWDDFGLIDFSAGDNMFADLMQGEFGNRLTMVNSYDINPGSPFVEARDWFAVYPQEFRHIRPPKLVIGFNPPFGFSGKFARDFIKHAVDFQPDVMICVVPNYLREFEIDGYRKVSNELLDPKTSFRTTHAIWGTRLALWKKEDGLRHCAKPQKRLQVPDGITFKSSYSSVPDTSWWSKKSTLWVRRSGANPGLKLLFCNNAQQLYMIDKSGEFVLVKEKKQIKNNIINYCSFSIVDATKWRWVGGDEHELLSSVLVRMKALNYERTTMVPYMDIHTVWSVVWQFIVAC
jgi:hypothetical protein